MKSAESPFRCVLDLRALLGESPVWDPVKRVLWFVDIDAPAIHRFDPASGRHDAMPMPASAGCLALRESGGLVAALRDGIWFVDEGGNLGTRVAAAPYAPAHHRFNDGRCDRQGRFFAGSMNERRDAPTGALSRLDADHTLHTVLDGMTISNGLAWSPDGRTMYHADTPTRTIRAYDYDIARGTPSNARVFAKFEGDTERPDGGAVDSAGNYWTSFYRGGRVVALSPRGEVVADYPVPAMCPTMCAFGGEDLRTLYVTTARNGRDAAELERLPQSGSVFAMRVDVPGLEEPRYAG